MGRGEYGRPVAVAGGKLAHHANAACNKEQDIDNRSRADGGYAEGAGARPTPDRLPAPVERGHDRPRKQDDFVFGGMMAVHPALKRLNWRRAPLVFWGSRKPVPGPLRHVR